MSNDLEPSKPERLEPECLEPESLESERLKQKPLDSKSSDSQFKDATDPSNNNPTRSMGLGMTVIAWVILLGMLVVYFTGEEKRQANPNQQPNTEIIDGQQTLVLQANRQNHFVVTGKVNGSKAMLLLDTGATRVAVPEDMAQALGLVKGRPGYAQTANGQVRTYSTRIDRLEMGNIVLLNVAADINPGMNGMNGLLLGMSALSQIEFTQRDGQLFLTQ
ncbi:TIGR02281 family clan AA aspartic protease [Pseudomonadales bacterium]|nr:TIGR02281 family clan AA aspartic protease [Pseudomonadales bacterium]